VSVLISLFLAQVTKTQIQLLKLQIIKKYRNNNLQGKQNPGRKVLVLQQLVLLQSAIHCFPLSTKSLLQGYFLL